MSTVQKVQQLEFRQWNSNFCRLSQPVYIQYVTSCRYCISTRVDSRILTRIRVRLSNRIVAAPLRQLESIVRDHVGTSR